MSLCSVLKPFIGNFVIIFSVCTSYMNYKQQGILHVILLLFVKMAVMPEYVGL